MTNVDRKVRPKRRATAAEGGWPSLREVCLLGLENAGETWDGTPGAWLEWEGRTYRVAAWQGSFEPEGLGAPGYLHLKPAWRRGFGGRLSGRAR